MCIRDRTSLLHTVLGVSATHERFAELSALFTQLNRPVELFLPTPRRTQETYEAINAIVVALIAAAKDHAPAHASVLGTMAQRHEPPFGDATATGNLILMVKEGSIMVRGLLRLSLIHI